MKNPLVSVVILTWNRKDDLLETVAELKESTYAPIEIIVVDNGSNDGTQEEINEKFSEVNFIRLEKNVGIAGFNIQYSIFNIQYSGGKGCLWIQWCRGGHKEGVS